MPLDKEIDPNNINWNGYENVATLHQPDKGSAYWEWINHGLSTPESEVKHGPLDKTRPTNGLPSKYSHVVYCVVVIKPHALAPPTPVKKNLPPYMSEQPPKGGLDAFLPGR